MSELLNCPFCGGEAVYRPDHTTECIDKVSCASCDFWISDTLAQGDCIEFWNTRTPQPDSVDMEPVAWRWSNPDWNGPKWQTGNVNPAWPKSENMITEPLYSQAQLEAVAKEARKKALEEALEIARFNDLADPIFTQIKSLSDQEA